MTNDQMREEIRRMIFSNYEEGGIRDFDEYSNVLEDLFEHQLLDLLPKKALQCILDEFNSVRESGPWDGTLLTDN
ncbi:hypothetical protein [Bacillus phage BvP]